MLAWFSVRRRLWLLLLLVGLTGGDVVGVGVPTAAAEEPQYHKYQQYHHRRSFSSCPVSSPSRTTITTATAPTSTPTVSARSSSYTSRSTRNHNHTRSSPSSSWTKTHRSSWFGYGLVVGVSVAKKQKHQKSKSQQHHPDPPYNNIDANKILLTNRRTSISPSTTSANESTTTTTTILDVQKMKTILQQVFLILAGTILAIPVSVIGCVVCLGAVPLLVYIWGRTLVIELLTNNNNHSNVTTSSSSSTSSQNTTVVTTLQKKVIPVPMTIALSGIVVLLCGLFVDYHFQVSAAFSKFGERTATLLTLPRTKTTTPIILLVLLGLLEGWCFVRRIVYPEK